MFPFDSGASQNGLYEPEVMAKDALATYELIATAESARRVVKCFFDVDPDYLSNKPKDGLHFGPTEKEVDSYYQLIRGGGHPDCDDRRSAIEVQLADDLDLRGDILMAVVLPIHFLDDPSLRKTIGAVWKAQPLTYYADIGMRPLEFHGAVRQLVRQFYVESSVI
jgi:hypothetical protein